MSEMQSATHTLTRRNFLKTTTAAAAASALGGGVLASCSPQQPAEDLAATGAEAPASESTFITSQCRSNCNNGCLHKIEVRDGKMVNITKDHFPTDSYTGICLRGQSNLYRTYSAERLMYPMKRKEGTERGAGEWERISWDQAIEEIGSKLKAVIDQYGPKAVLRDCLSGCLTLASGPLPLSNRMANALGCTVPDEVNDRNAMHGSYRVMGLNNFGNELTDMLNSSMIVVWGCNPIYSEMNTWHHIRLAQEKGAKVVVIDPVKSATAHKADQYIATKYPGADVALVLAMINHCIQNDYLKHDFVMYRTNAPFLVRRDNGAMMVREGSEGGSGPTVLGVNGLPVVGSKTYPEQDYYVISAKTGEAVLWGDLAEGEEPALEGVITVNGVECDTVFTLMKDYFAQFSFEEASDQLGADVDTLRTFAEEFCTIGSVTCNVPFGIDHYQNGYLFYQALCILLGLTGNYGGEYGRDGGGLTGMLWPANPLRMVAVVDDAEPIQEIPQFELYNVFRDQKYKGENYPLRAIISAASNSMSNYAEQNRWFEDIFPNLDLWVVMDNAWTDTARHADYVLPASFWYEVEDLRTSQNLPYLTICRQVVDPLYESKPDCQIISLIMNAIDPKYSESFPVNWTPKDWVDYALDNDAARESNVTRTELEEKTAIRVIGKDENAAVQKGDPEDAFPINHGRLTLYWEDPVPRFLYNQEFTEEEIAKQHFPYFREPGEVGRSNPLREKYPLAFMQLHERFRTHTQYNAAANLLELCPEPYIRISDGAAKVRGIKDGDTVEVFNDRGRVVVKAMIDNSFPDTVVSLPKGWQRDQFIEGGYSELTTSELDPWGVGGAFYDVLCEVRLWEGKEE